MSASFDSSERHPDTLDQASDLTLRMADAAVLRARRMNAPEQVQNPDGSWPQTECDDCGGEIEAGRLALGKIRCLGCQTEREHLLKMRG